MLTGMQYALGQQVCGGIVVSHRGLQPLGNNERTGMNDAFLLADSMWATEMQQNTTKTAFSSERVFEADMGNYAI